MSPFLLLTVTVSLTFLVFHDLDSFEAYRSGILYTVLSLNWDLSAVFLMIRMELWVLRRKITELQCLGSVLTPATLLMWLEDAVNVPYVLCELTPSTSKHQDKKQGFLLSLFQANVDF